MADKKEDSRPDFLKNNEVGTGFVEYQGKRYIYTIVDRSLEPKLPGFLGFIEGSHLFISEEVPERFRHPQLIHEIIEFTMLKGLEGRCLAALKIELEHVPETIRDDYLGYRTKFFQNLVEYKKKSKDEELKREIQGSLEYLLTLS